VDFSASFFSNYSISRTVDVASAYYAAMLFGTIALEPAADEDMIDLKNAKMTVVCKNTDGYNSNYNSSVDAQLRGRYTFWFGPTTTQSKKSVIVKY
jgi:hypothetical protein